MAIDTSIEISAKDKTRAALASAEKNLASLDNGINKVMRAMGALAGAGAIGAVIKESIAAADAIAKAADAADVSTKSLQELRYAANQTGVSTQQLDDGLRRFARRLGLAAEGGGPAAAAFEQMGISALNADGKLRNTETVLDDVVGKLAGLQSQAERAALASAFFGDDAGPKLALLLKQGESGIAQLRKEANDLGLVLEDKAIRNSEKAGDAMDRLAKVLQTKTIKAIADNAEAIEKLADGLLGLVNLAGKAITALNDMGEAAGKNVALLFDTTQIGKMQKLQKLIADTEAQIKIKENLAFYPDFMIEMDRRNLEKFRQQLQAVYAERDALYGTTVDRGTGLPAAAPAGAPPPPNRGGGDSTAFQVPVNAELLVFGEKQDQFNARLQARLDSVAQALMTEEQRLSQSYVNREMIVNEAFENGLIEEERRKELLEQLEEQHQEKLLQIQERSLSAQERLWNQGLQGKLQVTSNVLAQLANLMQSGSKKQFEIGKKAAIAQTVIDTYSMAVKSYNALAGIPIVGPILGAIAAGAAILYGKSQIDRIKSQQFGDGGGAVGTFPASPNTGLPTGGGLDTSGGGELGGIAGEQPLTQQPQRVVNITIQGNSFTRDDMRELIENINREIGDGAELRANVA